MTDWAESAITAHGAHRILAEAERNAAYAATVGVPWLAAVTAARVETARRRVAQLMGEGYGQTDPGGPDYDVPADWLADMGGRDQ